ncbi:MAG: hypothetical protein AB7S38_40010 [Vulcanimicrobiota bacterium]
MVITQTQNTRYLAPPRGKTTRKGATEPQDAFAPSSLQAPEPTLNPQQPQLSGWRKTVLAVALATSALTGIAGNAMAAPMAVLNQDTQQQQVDLPVVIIPEGTPRLDVIREVHQFNTSGGTHETRTDYSPVGVHLGGGLVHDANGNLTMIPSLAHDWNLTIDNFEMVNLQNRTVSRFGHTVHYSPSASKRFVFTEHDHSVDIQSTRGRTTIEKNEQGQIHVLGPDGLDYTITPQGSSFAIFSAGQNLSVLRVAGEIRVTDAEGRVTGGSSLSDAGLEVVAQTGRAKVTRSAGGVITEVDGSRGWSDYKLIRDGDVMLIQKPGRDQRVEINPEEPLRQARARFDQLAAQLEARDPGYAQRHPVIMSLLEYAAANPALLVDEDGSGLLEAGTRVATVGTLVETGVALTRGATALSLAENAQALGAAALTTKAAAEAAASAGQLTQAAALANEARELGSRAKELGAEAMKKGQTAKNAAEVARIMMGVGAALEMVDGGMGLSQGKSEKALIEGAVAVAQARMDELSSELSGPDLERAMADYTHVMRVLEELQKEAGKKVTVGKLKIVFGGVMLASAILGPEAPMALGIIGLAGTAGTTIYEHWDPLYEFFTGEKSQGPPAFLEVVPGGDQIKISLDNKKGG